MLVLKRLLRANWILKHLEFIEDYGKKLFQEGSNRGGHALWINLLNTVIYGLINKSIY